MNIDEKITKRKKESQTEKQEIKKIANVLGMNILFRCILDVALPFCFAVYFKGGEGAPICHDSLKWKHKDAI